MNHSTPEQPNTPNSGHSGSSSAQTVQAFKGFNADWTCGGSNGVPVFQYEIGKTYEHQGEVVACGSGFHACEHPLDVLKYYPPATSRYAMVEQRGQIARHSDDSKVASSLITVKAELSIAGLVSAAVEYVKSKCDPVTSEHATGWSGAASATGESGAALTTGWHSFSEVRPAANGKPQYAVAIACGYASKARAPLGSAIVLCERNSNGELLNIFASKVGENGIESDKWYVLRDGTPVEAS